MFNFKWWIKGSGLKDNVILGKSFKFAVRIVKLYKYLCTTKKEYILSKQLLRCGTSISANVNEAQAGQIKLTLYQKWVLQVKKQEKQNTG